MSYYAALLKTAADLSQGVMRFSEESLNFTDRIGYHSGGLSINDEDQLVGDSFIKVLHTFVKAQTPDFQQHFGFFLEQVAFNRIVWQDKNDAWKVRDCLPVYVEPEDYVLAYILTQKRDTIDFHADHKKISFAPYRSYLIRAWDELMTGVPQKGKKVKK